MNARLASTSTQTLPVEEKRHANAGGAGAALVAFMLFLLPLERILLPANTKVADIGMVLLMIYGLQNAYRTNASWRFPLAAPMWLILIASLVATLFGFRHSDSLIAILQEIYLYLSFIFLLNTLARLPPRARDGAVSAWAIVGLLQATAAVMGMLRIGPSIFYVSPLGLSYSGGIFNRAVGTFVNPNATAAYLSTSFFVLLAARWSAGWRIVLGTWILAGIFATGSMGALFSSAMSLAVIWVAYEALRSQRFASAFGALAGLGLAAVAMLVFFLVVSPWVGSDSAQELPLLTLTLGRLPRSVGGRLVLIQTAWRMYTQYPLGTGPNTSVTYIGSLHNDYIAFLIERGPLGAIGWLALVLSTLVLPLYATYRRLGSYRYWPVLALWGGFLALALNAFSHEVSHFRQLWVLMAFLFAVAYTAPLRAGPERDEPGDLP